METFWLLALDYVHFVLLILIFTTMSSWSKKGRCLKWPSMNSTILKFYELYKKLKWFVQIIVLIVFGMEILPDNKDKWIFCNGIDQIISPNHKFTRFLSDPSPIIVCVSFWLPKLVQNILVSFIMWKPLIYLLSLLKTTQIKQYLKTYLEKI